MRPRPDVNANVGTDIGADIGADSYPGVLRRRLRWRWLYHHSPGFDVGACRLAAMVIDSLGCQGELRSAPPPLTTQAIRRLLHRQAARSEHARRRVPGLSTGEARPHSRGRRG